MYKNTFYINYRSIVVVFLQQKNNILFVFRINQLEPIYKKKYNNFKLKYLKILFSL